MIIVIIDKYLFLMSLINWNQTLLTEAVSAIITEVIKYLELTFRSKMKNSVNHIIKCM